MPVSRKVREQTQPATMIVESVIFFSSMKKIDEQTRTTESINIAIPTTPDTFARGCR